MKAKEFRDMTSQEIKNAIKENRGKLLKIRFDISSRQIKNHREVRTLKKDVARAMAVLAEKTNEKK